MYTVSFEDLANHQAGPDGVPADAMSANAPRSVPFEEAVALADMEDADARLRTMSDGGILNWSRFDIQPFARLMPSIAYLDKVDREGGIIDFRYGFVGENINAIAKRNLRGICLRDVLVGEKAEAIIQEYATTLEERVPRASSGNVSISDLTWVRYLRFLYPTRTETGLDRVFLIMLFAAP